MRREHEGCPSKLLKRQPRGRSPAIERGRPDGQMECCYPIRGYECDPSSLQRSRRINRSIPMRHLETDSGDHMSTCSDLQKVPDLGSRWMSRIAGTSIGCYEHVPPKHVSGWRQAKSQAKRPTRGGLLDGVSQRAVTPVTSQHSRPLGETRSAHAFARGKRRLPAHSGTPVAPERACHMRPPPHLPSSA